MSEWEVWSLLGSSDQRAAEQDTHREPYAGTGQAALMVSQFVLWRSRHDAVGIGVPSFFPNPGDSGATRPGRQAARYGRGMAAMSGRALSRTLVTATVLFLVEAFLFNQGVLVGLTALGAVLGGVPRALLAWQRGDISTARLRIARTGIYVAVALLGIGTVVAQAYLARSRANTIIVAARQYEAQHGRLPDRLDELVPAFIASIPFTNYTLIPPMNKFMYLTPPLDGVPKSLGNVSWLRLQQRGEEPGRHVLMWGIFQIGGRPYYDFENHRWGVFLD